ncbi:MAG: hypothetical protein Kow0069_16970 [Promethearchaeota archaeon]
MRLTREGLESTAFAGFPSEFVAFHWHGDAFDVPPGGKLLATSEACATQSYAWGAGDRVLGLQFHLEVTIEGIQALATHCREDLRPGPFVQAEVEKLVDGAKVRSANELAHKMLDSAWGPPPSGESEQG